MEELKDYFLSKKGTKIFYRYDKKEKNFPVVVLLHGWVMNYTAMEMTREFLNNKGISTLNIDIRGHGHSEADDFSFDLVVDDIKGILEKENIKDIIMFGYCMGGMIASEFESKYPQFIKGMIFINTTYFNPALQFPYIDLRLLRYFFKNLYKILKDKEKNWYFYKSWIKLLFGGVMPKRLEDKTFKHFKYNEGNKMIDFKSYADKIDKTDIFIHYEGLTRTDHKIVEKAFKVMSRMNLKPQFSKIDVPTFIIASKNDAICRTDIAQKIKKMVPDSEMHILEKSDHLSILQENKEINNLVYDFFKRKFNLE